VVTSNVAFDSWGTLFGNDVIASAILDRLLHQSEIFAISGPSYRLKDKRAAGTANPAGSTGPVATIPSEHPA
jgi:DNA replication protein DnaC